VLGVDDAAHLSGAPPARGTALVRRAADAAPHTVRIALTTPDLVSGIASSATGPAPRRAWLPPLPERLALDEALTSAAGDGLVLGLADEPDQQRQTPVVLAARERGLCALGRAGSGRTTLLATLAAQARRRVWVPSHPEHAWDAVAELVDAPPRHGTLVLVDDVDALLAQYPAEYAQAFADRLEQVIHTAAAGGAQIILSAQRLAGAVARMAELLPRRVLLAPASRADILAGGGVPEGFTTAMPPGRAIVDGALVQVALPPSPPPRELPDVPGWDPGGRVTAVVARSGPALVRLRSAAGQRGVVTLDVDEALRRHDADGTLPRGTVVIGDAEQWQRGWRLWQAMRPVDDILIDTDSGGDYRVLTGDRALPPYCLPGRNRAWLLRAGGAPVRVCVRETGRE
jgi:S-DNA-T family DNA segregation ATPase FtsK/SpoIIIE